MSLEQPCISTVYGFCCSYPLLTEAIVQVHNEKFHFSGLYWRSKIRQYRRVIPLFFFEMYAVFKVKKFRSANVKCIWN